MNIITRAENFLKLHEGSCSVSKDSFLANAFLLMEQAGKCTVKQSGTPGYIDVYSPDFKPRFTAKDE